MIARMWHGKVLKERSAAYHQYLLETGLPDYEATPGNRGVWLLKKDEGEVTHFYTLTFWESLEAIQLFAGEDYLKAKYYPEDTEFLLELEEGVNQFDIVESLTANFRQ